MYLEFIFVSGVRSGSRYLFPLIGYPADKAPFISTRILLSALHCGVPFVMNQVMVYVGLFLISLFIPFLKIVF